MSEESKREELPPRTESEPDAKGVKTVVEWRYNELGQKVKITKKVRLVRKVTRTSRRVAERRNNWPKFGACAGLPAGPEPSVTIVAIDQVHIEHPNEEQLKKESVDLEKGSIIVCRSCGMTGDHWTLNCPYRDPNSAPMARGDTGEEEQPSGLASGAPGKYVPPSMRNRQGSAAEASGTAPGGGGGGGGGDDRFGGRGGEDRDAATLRVTNVSEATTEQDLQELFRRFGPVARVFLAKDRVTKASRGFAFVSFIRKDDAERAMNELQGYGYDHLILKIEWARPSAPKEGEAPRDPSAKFRTGYGGALPQDRDAPPRDPSAKYRTGYGGALPQDSQRR